MNKESLAVASQFCWHRQYDPGVPAEIEIPKITLSQALSQSARDFPQAVALRFLGRKITYRQLIDQIARLKTGLYHLGLRPGQRLALLLPNCPQAVLGYYAALELGAVVVMLNPLSTPRELAYQLKDSGARILIGLDHLVPKLNDLSEAVNLERLIVTSLADYLPFPLNWLYPFKARRQGWHTGVRSDKGEIRFTGVLKTPLPPAPEGPQECEAMAVLQYTGGTTGVPKAAILTHQNLMTNVAQINAWLPRLNRGAERVLAVLPFSHAFGMTAAMNWPLSLGGTVIILPRFEVDQVLKTIQKYRPTVFPAVPTIFVALINHPRISKFDLSSIWGCISGSAPLPREVQERFESLTRGHILEGYGLTEAAPVTHLNPIQGVRKPGSIGLPFPNTEARIVDAESGTRTLGPEEVGELIIRGPQVMKGYWQNPAETALVLRDGWLYTGDLATMDAEGYFYIVDRKKDVIIAGGYKIYPREVEEVLYQHPRVLDAVVIGVPDPYRGETVKAFVVPKPGMQLTVEDIQEFCKAQLAAYKVPRIIELRTELPKTMVGKVLRRALKEESLVHEDSTVS
ncbi:MAG: long-chain fatty acid--CoA ligase [Deltaproteobacteria bacterium]|nr:long-chain fatty acid--CoA ligase [Deltaproteobacteria bacterium]MBW1951904.1 long-chain fatty acid--CoA ligase [Deltaproteobacteria bacterium]MBW1986954.1 long-chain fatty acid--CoA ligase [Deltaproteobacteria bacterium]MBW2134469.1 long-chain fatty acid--CoA ligase [Deltaproteobacteria bacterium]